MCHSFLQFLMFEIITLINHIQSINEQCTSINPDGKYDCIFRSKENIPCCYLGYLDHSTRVARCFELEYQSADQLIQALANTTNSLPKNTGSVQATCGMIFEQCSKVEKPAQKADCNQVKIEIPYHCCFIIKPNGERSCYPIDKEAIGSFAKLYQIRENLKEKPVILCKSTYITITSIIINILIILL